jgi:Dna[CI] antecedent, DciA
MRLVLAIHNSTQLFHHAVSARIVTLTSQSVTDHSFQSAASGLERVVTRSLRKASSELAPVLAWPLACGSAVAARTRAIEFTKGVLHVEVADAGWKRELQVLAPRYLASINRHVAQNVSRIEFVIRKQSGPTR